jgi:lipid-A-disaccharide synthase-like uncharacterized protein
LGELDAGKYTAPQRIDEDREVIISAVSDASPLEPARAIIQLSTAGRLEQARRRREQAEVKAARARAEHAAAKASFSEHDQQLERQLLWLVLVTGALGSFVYSARSFVDFVGNRALRSSWTVWYLLYPLIGAALALIFFIAIRGGLINPAAQGADINPYGLIAMSGLVGMFSKQATAKLGELFWNIFKTDRNDKELKDKM